MNSWYICIHDGIMTKLYSTRSKMKKLLKNKTIIEYRKCDTRQQADYFCNKYNNKMEDFNNEEI